MNEEEEDPALAAAAEAVTDGMSVDWTGLKRRNPGLAEDLALLERIAEVAAAYRVLREGGVDGER
jgi:hypothetical protein